MEPVILRGAPPEAASFYGYGNGYGDGYGNGYGNGYGDGYGDGYGYGYGYGDGYGYGSGDGYGDGYGYGYAYGYGDGSGEGYGSGYGDGEYWRSCARSFANKWPRNQQARFAELMKTGSHIAYWRSDLNGMPSNGGGKIEPAAPGVVHTAPGPLDLCHCGTLHATLLPPKWEGSRWWIVALHGEVVGDEEKYGCLKREIIGECL